METLKRIEKMVNGKKIQWKNYKEANIKSPGTFQERPGWKRKNRNLKAEIDV